MTVLIRHKLKASKRLLSAMLRSHDQLKSLKFLYRWIANIITTLDDVPHKWFEKYMVGKILLMLMKNLYIYAYQSLFNCYSMFQILF